MTLWFEVENAGGHVKIWRVWNGGLGIQLPKGPHKGVLLNKDEVAELRDLLVKEDEHAGFAHNGE